MRRAGESRKGNVELRAVGWYRIYTVVVGESEVGFNTDWQQGEG